MAGESQPLHTIQRLEAAQKALPKQSHAQTVAANVAQAVALTLVFIALGAAVAFLTGTMLVGGIAIGVGGALLITFTTACVARCYHHTRAKKAAAQLSDKAIFEAVKQSPISAHTLLTNLTNKQWTTFLWSASKEPENKELVEALASHNSHLEHVLANLAELPKPFIEALFNEMTLEQQQAFHDRILLSKLRPMIEPFIYSPSIELGEGEIVFKHDLSDSFYVNALKTFSSYESGPLFQKEVRESLTNLNDIFWFLKEKNLGEAYEAKRREQGKRHYTRERERVHREVAAVMEMDLNEINKAARIVKILGLDKSQRKSVQKNLGNVEQLMALWPVTEAKPAGYSIDEMVTWFGALNKHVQETI